MQPTLPRLDLVLVGGGHAHVQVLRSLAMHPQPDLRVTVVLDDPVAVYSGMVPGFVAGEYGLQELEIDAVPLARRAGASVVLSPATRIDAVARRIELRGRPPLPYDLASINVGSTVRGLDLPGVEHALPTRPIGRFARAVEERLRALRDLGRPARLVIVGAGAAGVELAFTLHARLQRELGRAPEVTLLDPHPEPLPGSPDRLRGAVAREAQARGIHLRSARVQRVEPTQVSLEEGPSLPSDLTVWVTGAAPLPLLAASPLPKDKHGFVLVGPTLQVEGHPDLFAVGDCASLPFAPWVRKAGVYAVREGAVLTENLRAACEGRQLDRYRPQKDFLTLLNLGDGTAIGAKGRWAVRGRWVWRLKDRIDRAFMRRFQVLGPEGAPLPAFPAMESDEPMLCGGCAAKVGPASLHAALSSLPLPSSDPSVVLGLADADDAAAVRTPGGDLLLSTVDAFEAFVDDPYLVGRIAAVNALSDLHAKGIQPRYALALVGVPDGPPAKVEVALHQAMLGVRAALDPLGVTLLGGHSTRAGSLSVGLTAFGFGEEPLRIADAKAGDHLLLSKPLGTGVLFFAHMQGRARGRDLARALASMQRDSRAASEVARAHAHAATDISGFGLAGHLLELTRASGLAARLDLDALPALPGVPALLAAGLRSTAHPANQTYAAPATHGGARHPLRPLLFDPQTSGGLLLAVPPEALDAARDGLAAAGFVACIGTLEEGEGLWLDPIASSGAPRPG